MNQVDRRWQIPRAPEIGYKYEVFISYTTRHRDLDLATSIVGRFQEHLRYALRERGLEDIAFLDRYTWKREGKVCETPDLAQRLRTEIMASLSMICFVDPVYFRSGWCTFELQTFLASVHNEHCRCGNLILVNPIPWDSLNLQSYDYREDRFWAPYLQSCVGGILEALTLPRCGPSDPFFLRYGGWPTI